MANLVTAQRREYAPAATQSLTKGGIVTDMEDDDGIVHTAENGTTRGWTIQQLLKIIESGSPELQSIPAPVQVEFCKRRISGSAQWPKYLTQFFVEVWPKLSLDEAGRFELARHYIGSRSSDLTRPHLPRFGVQEADNQVALVADLIKRGLSAAAVFREIVSSVNPAARLELVHEHLINDPKLPEHITSLGLEGPDQMQLLLQLARLGRLADLWALPALCFTSKKFALELAKAGGPEIFRQLWSAGFDETELIQLFTHYAEHNTSDFCKKIAPTSALSGLGNDKKILLMERCLSTGKAFNPGLAGKDLPHALNYRWLMACAIFDTKNTAQEFPANLIADAQQRMEIAKVCVKHRPNSVGEYLGNFNLEDKAGLASLFCECAQHNPLLLRSLPELALRPAAEFELIIQVIKLQTTFDDFPFEVLLGCSDEQLPVALRQVFDRNTRFGMELLKTLIMEDRMMSEDGLPFAEESVKRGYPPTAALDALVLSDKASRSLAVRLLALWWQSGSTEDEVMSECKKICRQHPKSNKKNPVYQCETLIQPIAKKSFPNLSQISDKLLAIGGPAVLHLFDMDDKELALLAELAQRFKLGSLFDRNRDADQIWPLRKPLGLTAVINLLAKQKIAITAEQCERALEKLAISGTPKAAQEIWKAIGDHARSVLFFRSLAGDRRAEDGDPENGEDADAAEWLENRQFWLAMVLMQIEAMPVSNTDLQSMTPLLARLAVMKNPGTRQTLTALCFAGDYAELARLKDAAAANVSALFCMLPFLDQNPWLKSALENDAKKSRLMKRFGVARPLIEDLIALRQNELSVETKSALLKQGAPQDPNDLKAVTTQIRRLVNLLRLSQADALKLLDDASGNSSSSASNMSLEERLKLALMKVLVLKSGLDLDRYEQTFGKFRDPNTLITYAANLKSKPKALEGLGRAVHAFLNDDYPAIRYRDVDLFQNMGPDLLERWKTKKSEPYPQSAAESPAATLPSSSSRPRDPAQIIKSKILNDRHLDLGTLPHLAARLGVTLDVAESDAPLDISAFEEAMIAFLDQPTEPNLNTVSDLLDQTQPEAELKNDLKMIQASMQPVSAGPSRENWRVRVTEDFQQLLRIGTDVEGSCQRIDGDPDLNCGVAGTLLDGSSELCEIVDESSKTVGRLILRMV